MDASGDVAVDVSGASRFLRFAGKPARWSSSRLAIAIAQLVVLSRHQPDMTLDELRAALLGTPGPAEGGAVPAPLGVGATPERAERAGSLRVPMHASAVASPETGAPAPRAGAPGSSEGGPRLSADRGVLLEEFDELIEVHGRNARLAEVFL